MNSRNSLDPIFWSTAKCGGFLGAFLCLVGCTSKFNLQDGVVTEDSTEYRFCQLEQKNEKKCLVDKTGSYVYADELGGRSVLGTDISGLDGAASVDIPAGWYDGAKTVTFTDSDLKSSNAGAVRSGFNLFGAVIGTLVTSKPAACLEGNKSDALCTVFASGTDTYYAYHSAYGGRSALCDLDSPLIKNSSCFVSSINSRFSEAPIIDAECVASDSAVAAQCTAVTDNYWYNSVFGGRGVSCAANANPVTGCWLNVAGSVTLTTANSTGGAADSCLEANEVGYLSPCNTLTAGWYVYGSAYGGRAGNCINNDMGSCYFEGSYTSVEPNLNSANIKVGVTIFGVAGKYEGDGAWSSAAHRSPAVSPISFSAEALLYGASQNLPLGYRSVPVIATDDEGVTSLATAGVERTGWTSCGLSGTITDRINSCAGSFGINSIWDGSSSANAGQGSWKLVHRGGNPTGSGIYREVWRDERTGLLWSSLVSKAINWCKAVGSQAPDSDNICNQGANQNQPGGGLDVVSACYTGLAGLTDSSAEIDVLGKGATASNPLAAEWRVPTVYDYEVAENNGFRYVLPDAGTDGGLEWTATTRQGATTKAWVFHGKTGSSEIRDRNDATIAVRCIGRALP